MYHLTVTAKQTAESTHLMVVLWDIHEDQSRDQIRYSSLTIPEIQGGLFEEEPEAYFERCIEWLADIHGTWHRTHQ